MMEESQRQVEDMMEESLKQAEGMMKGLSM